MTVWVYRNGELVDRRMVGMIEEEERARRAGDFPTPSVSRITPYESPVTGKEVTSWRQRDQEMRDHNCYDGRDWPDQVYHRGMAAQLKEAEDAARNPEPDAAVWRDTPDDT